MMKHIIFLVLFSISSSVYADWLEVGKRYKKLIQIQVISYGRVIADNVIFKKPTDVDCFKTQCDWKDENGDINKIYYDPSFQFIKVVRASN